MMGKFSTGHFSLTRVDHNLGFIVFSQIPYCPFPSVAGENSNHVDG